MEAATFDSARKVASGVLKAFENVSTVGLRYPGEGVSRRSEKDQITFAGNQHQQFAITTICLIYVLFEIMLKKGVSIKYGHVSACLAVALCVAGIMTNLL